MLESACFNIQKILGMCFSRENLEIWKVGVISIYSGLSIIEEIYAAVRKLTQKHLTYCRRDKYL